MACLQYEGGLTYVPVTETYPAAYYWGINVTSSTYGTHAVIPASTAGIVDTGTTRMFPSPLFYMVIDLMQMSRPSEVLLADNFFAVYLLAISGAKLDSNTGLIEIPHSSVPFMQPLNFLIAGRVFTMDVAAQLIPTDQNEAWGGVAGKQYGVVANLGTNSGEGLDFIIGQKFLERYYVVSVALRLWRSMSLLIAFGRYSTRTPAAWASLRRKLDSCRTCLNLSLPIHRNNTFTAYQG